jgi:hemerythrin
MTIQWDEGLRIGIPSLDKHHEDIFVYFDKLTVAIQNGDSSSMVVEMLVLLENYISIHFDEEDKLMNECDYPNIAAQREQHAVFREHISEIMNLQNGNTSTNEISMKVLASLTRYCINHINKLDRELLIMPNKAMHLFNMETC